MGGIDRPLIGAYLLMQRILIAACVGLLGGVSYVIITVLPEERKTLGALRAQGQEHDDSREE